MNVEVFYLESGRRKSSHSPSIQFYTRGSSHDNKTSKWNLKRKYWNGRNKFICRWKDFHIENLKRSTDILEIIREF